MIFEDKSLTCPTYTQTAGHRSRWLSIASPSGPAASLPECQSTDLMKANSIINHTHPQHSSSWDLSKCDSCSEGERGGKAHNDDKKENKIFGEKKQSKQKGDISKEMGWEPLWARQKAVSPCCTVVKGVRSRNPPCLQKFLFLNSPPFSASLSTLGLFLLIMLERFS